jgi:hypothetical protein
MEVAAPEPGRADFGSGHASASAATSSGSGPATPAFLSLCSIRGNQKELCATLTSLLPAGLPIYLHLSEAPHLRDEGFPRRERDFGEPLRRLLAENRRRICVRFVENTGPYRKLLPLLREMWGKPCAIITVDDDTVYDPSVFAAMLRLHAAASPSGSSPPCVANRGFALDWRPPVDYFARDVSLCCPLHNFHTGKGAVLYTPAMFTATPELIFDQERFMRLAPFNDDFWFNALRVANGVPCVLTGLRYMTRDLTNNNALYANYNVRRNNEQLNAVLGELAALGHRCGCQAAAEAAAAEAAAEAAVEAAAEAAAAAGD